MKNLKSMLKSKTLWFNILSGIILILPQMIDLGFELPIKWVTLIVLVGNFILRFMTSKPVTEK